MTWTELSLELKKEYCNIISRLLKTECASRNCFAKLREYINTFFETK